MLLNNNLNEAQKALALTINNPLCLSGVFNAKNADNTETFCGSKGNELIALVKADEAFVEKVLCVIESNMSDCKFNFTRFAVLMNVSGCTLNRKMNLLFGVSAGVFIRSMRMKKAIQLLNTDSYNISEIAFRLGFVDPRYFSKCFKDEFGLTPKEYRLSVKKNSRSSDNPSSDELFFEKAIVKLEEKISESSLSFADFASELNVSKATLYRKLKSFTGKSPCEFIRSVRLKKSAQLLKSSGCNIIDIAITVGFNDPRHFSRCFKNEYGLTPTEYQQLSVG